MKITKSQLKQIIKEELEGVLIEQQKAPSIDRMKAIAQGRASDADYKSRAEQAVAALSKDQFDQMMKDEDRMPTGIGTGFDYPSKKMRSSRSYSQGQFQGSINVQNWLKSANEEKRLELFRTVLRMHGYERNRSMATNFLHSLIQTFSAMARGSELKRHTGAPERLHAKFLKSAMSMFKIKKTYHVDTKKYPKLSASLIKAGFKPNSEGVIISPVEIAVHRKFSDRNPDIKAGRSGSRQVLARLKKDFGFDRDEPGESPFINKTKEREKEVFRREND